MNIRTITKTIQVTLSSILMMLLFLSGSPVQAADDTTTQAGNVVMTINNLSLTVTQANLEFGLTPDGTPVTQQVQLQNNESINTTLTVPDVATANRWYLKISDTSGNLLLVLAGPYPPAVGGAYSEVEVPNPEIVSSPVSDKPIGQIAFPQIGAVFFFQASLDTLASVDTYSGNVWVDQNGDNTAQPEENTALQVGLVGNDLRGTAEVRIRNKTAPYTAILTNGNTVLATVSGVWDFSSQRVISSSFPAVPSIHGFQPLDGGGVFDLPNIFPKLEDPFSQAKTGPTWAVASGPQTDTTAARTPTDTESAYLNISILREVTNQPVASSEVEVATKDKTTYSGESDKSGTIKVNMVPGSYTVKASAVGYVAGESSVTVEKGQTQQVTIHLKPLQPTAEENAQIFLTNNWKILVIGFTVILGLIVFGLWKSHQRA